MFSPVANRGTFARFAAMSARFSILVSFSLCIWLVTVCAAQQQTPVAKPTAAAAAPSAGLPQLTDALFKNLKARWIGPAVMGGRVSDIAIDPRNPFVFYVALGHGGIFKTNDNGVTFQPIFESNRSFPSAQSRWRRPIRTSSGSARGKRTIAIHPTGATASIDPPMAATHGKTWD